MMTEEIPEDPLRRGSNGEEFLLRNSKSPTSLEERVAVLEIQVTFLKEKSKKDDEWKALMQEWIYQLHEEKLKAYKDKLAELACYSQVKEPVLIERRSGTYQMPSKIGNNVSVKRPNQSTEERNGSKKIAREVPVSATNGKKRANNSHGSSPEGNSNDDSKVNIFNGTGGETSQKKDAVPSTREIVNRSLADADTDYRFPENEIEMDFVDEQGDVIECSPDFADMVHITHDGDDSDESNSEYTHTATALYADVKNDDEEDYDGSLDCEVVSTQHLSESSSSELQGDRASQRYYMDGREEYSQIGKKDGDSSFLKSAIRGLAGNKSRGGKGPDFKIAGLEISELPHMGHDFSLDDSGIQYGGNSSRPPSLKPMKQKANTIHYLTEKKPNFQLRKGLEDFYEYIGHRVMDDAEVAQDSRYTRNGQRSFKVQCKKCNCVLSGHDSTNSNLWTHLSSAHGYSRPVPPKPKQVKLDSSSMGLSTPFSFLTQPHFLLASPEVILSTNYDAPGSSTSNMIDITGSDGNYDTVAGS